jgi:hypothetical protein
METYMEDSVGNQVTILLRRYIKIFRIELMTRGLWVKQYLTYLQNQLHTPVVSSAGLRLMGLMEIKPPPSPV